MPHLIDSSAALTLPVHPEPSTLSKFVSASIFWGGITFIGYGARVLTQSDEEISRWERIGGIAKIALGVGAMCFSLLAPGEVFELRAPMTLARLP